MSRAVALDPGTMFFQVAEKNKDGSINIKIQRNCFIELESSEDNEQILSQNNWQYISDNKNYFVLGEDAIKITRMFPHLELRRPMKNGILNKNEKKKMQVIAKMIENSIGKAPDKESIVCFCVSSKTIDKENIDNVFHIARMEGILKNLGWKTKKIEEGMGVIFSENPCIKEKNGEEIPYSGLGISFGSGKTNCVLSYRGLQVIGMSCTRGGDWLDQKVSDSTDVPLSIVTNIKETKLDFNNINYENDILFAMDSYYKVLIQFVFECFAKQFKKVKSQFESPMDIVIGGGTSMPNGFENKVKEVVKELDLPFKIKNIIKSKDPRNSVVKGLLVYAILAHKKIQKESKKNGIDDILKD